MPWTLLAGGSLVSVAANALHAILAAEGVVPAVVSALVAAVPPVVLLAVTQLSVILVQQSGPPTKARAARRQAEGPARTWLPSDRPAPARAGMGSAAHQRVMMTKPRLGDVLDLVCAGSSTAVEHSWSWEVRSGHAPARCPDHRHQVRSETDAARRRQMRAESPAWREKANARKREPKQRGQHAARQSQRRAEDATWREKANASARVRSKSAASKAWTQAHRQERIARDGTFLQLERARSRRYQAAHREAISDRNVGRGGPSTPESRDRRNVAARERYASNPQYRAKVLTDSQRRRVRRNARERGALTSVELLPLTWQDLAARDGWGCYICGGTCDPSDFVPIDGAPFRRMGPMYPTLDHVTPIAEGGKHSEANARLACSRCNSSKGRRPLAVCVRRRLRLGRPVSSALLVELRLVLAVNTAVRADIHLPHI